MKRIVAIVGVVMGLGAIGLTAAHAADSGPSTWCTDGGGTETPVPNPWASASYDHWENWNGWELYTLCWSTTPEGSDSPETAGGALRVARSQDGSDVGLWCYGDRTEHTVATVDCNNTVTVDGYPGLDRPAATVAGTAGVGPNNAGFGRTGAETGGLPNVTPGNPNAQVTSTTVASSNANCVYVNGEPNCPGVGATVADTDLATDDVQVEYRTTLDACVGAAGNPCLTTAPSSAAVTVGGGDADNSTVDGTLLGNIPVTYDTGKICVVSYNRPDCSTGPDS